MSAIRSTVTTLRSSAARQRAARAEQRQLERGLAHYRTAADRRDLYAILARHSEEQAAPIERILAKQDRAGAFTHLR